MRFIDWQSFKGQEAWDALDIAEIEGASVRIHWTDKPYKWHVNDGNEIFVVLRGEVDMHTRTAGIEQVRRMVDGDVFQANSGDEHVARPIGEAHILVIEKKGSI